MNLCMAARKGKGVEIEMSKDVLTMLDLDSFSQAEFTVKFLTRPFLMIQRTRKL